MTMLGVSKKHFFIVSINSEANATKLLKNIARNVIVVCRAWINGCIESKILRRY